MRNVDELRRVLDDHASLAPDGTGIVEAAQAAAVKIRRRHRIVYGATALAVTALLAVTGAAVPRLLATTTTPDESATRPGSQLQLTVSLAKNNGYRVESSGKDRNQQVMSVRREGTGDMWYGSVRVFDPGTFDPAPLLRGQKVTVRGHAAYLVPDLLVSKDGQTLFGWFGNDSRAPAVGWQDRSGAWVVVFVGTDGPPDQSTLLPLAEAVRISRPRDIVMPYRLRFVPDGLPPSYAEVGNGDHAYALLAFGVDPTPPIQPAATALQPPLEIRVYTLDRSRLKPYGNPTHKIAGYDVWYLTDRSIGSETDALLMVATENCQVNITVADRKQVTFDELKRMVERAEFKSCTDRNTWTPPLP